MLHRYGVCCKRILKLFTQKAIWAALSKERFTLQNMSLWEIIVMIASPGKTNNTACMWCRDIINWFLWTSATVKSVFTQVSHHHLAKRKENKKYGLRNLKILTLLLTTVFSFTSSKIVILGLNSDTKYLHPRHNEYQDKMYELMFCLFHLYSHLLQQFSMPE